MAGGPLAELDAGLSRRWRSQHARLREKVKQAFWLARERRKLPAEDFAVGRHKCKYCSTQAPCVVDESHGSVVCTGCGCVIDTVLREDVFGRGAAQYSRAEEDQMHSRCLALDRATGEKALRGGHTTKAYKIKLVGRAARDLLEMCPDQRVYDIAVVMFRSYSDARDKVHEYDKVLNACVLNAVQYLKQSAPSSSLPVSANPPCFSCDSCKLDFSCKKDVRMHSCSASSRGGRAGQEKRQRSESPFSEKTSSAVSEYAESLPEFIKCWEGEEREKSDEHIQQPTTTTTFTTSDGTQTLSKELVTRRKRPGFRLAVPKRKRTRRSCGSF